MDRDLHAHLLSLHDNQRELRNPALCTYVAVLCFYRVEADIEKALQLYRQAAALGDDDAKAKVLELEAGEIEEEEEVEEETEEEEVEEETEEEEVEDIEDSSSTNY